MYNNYLNEQGKTKQKNSFLERSKYDIHRMCSV